MTGNPITASAVAACILLAGTASAQSLAGTTGLLTIPTAEMPVDGTLSVGVNVIDQRYHGYTLPGYAEHRGIVQFATVGFLPFAEVGVRLTRVAGVAGQGIGDRMATVRVRAFAESTHRPALVLGAQDIGGTRRFHAFYVVASKTRHFARSAALGLHLGYGGDPIGSGRHPSVLNGVFGGVSVSPATPLTLMGDYDTHHVNVGARLRLWRFSVLGAAQNLDGLSGGVSYTQPLGR